MFGENALAEEAALVKPRESPLGYTGDDAPACPETAPFDPDVKFCWVSCHSISKRATRDEKMKIDHRTSDSVEYGHHSRIIHTVCFHTPASNSAHSSP
jgi:hypothetical protein